MTFKIWFAAGRLLHLCLQFRFKKNASFHDSKRVNKLLVKAQSKSIVPLNNINFKKTKKKAKKTEFLSRVAYIVTTFSKKTIVHRQY